MAIAPARRFAAAYLALQGTACVAWWLGLWLWPGLRARLAVPGWPEQTLLVFWLPDLVVWVGSSWAAALAVRARSRWGPLLLGCCAGGVLYPTLYSAALCWLTGAGALGLALMAPAASITAALAALSGKLLR
jgi:hypothetical protein